MPIQTRSKELCKNLRDTGETNRLTIVNTAEESVVDADAEEADVDVVAAEAKAEEATNNKTTQR